MAVRLVQVTLGAGATQVSSTATPVRQIMFQNNATHDCRIGDSTVTTSKGIKLIAGVGTLNSGPIISYASNLADWYIAGTAADVIDVLYLE